MTTLNSCLSTWPSVLLQTLILCPANFYAKIMSALEPATNKHTWLEHNKNCYGLMRTPFSHYRLDKFANGNYLMATTSIMTLCCYLLLRTTMYYRKHIQHISRPLVPPVLI